jgi:HSP20 family molecular chaperone IbpA
MESEFEPAVRTEETPEARIIIVDLPGFRREDLRVQVNNLGNLIISGERGVKEMGEITKVGGRVNTMQSAGQTFRKVIDVAENVNFDDITAKLKDQVLRVSLPFLQKNQKLLTQDVNGGGKAHDADQSEQSNPDERSSPLKQQGFMQERHAATQNDPPEVIRPDGYKEKASAAAEESKAEVPKHAHDFVHGEQPVSTHTQAVSAVQADSDLDQSQIIQSKSKKRKKDDESCLPSPNDPFPEKRIQIPSSSSGRSMFSDCGVLVATTLLVLCAGIYLSYIFRSGQAD